MCLLRSYMAVRLRSSLNTGFEGTHGALSLSLSPTEDSLSWPCLALAIVALCPHNRSKQELFFLLLPCPLLLPLRRLTPRPRSGCMPSPKSGCDLRYAPGWAILDSADPTKVLARSNAPLLVSTEAWEKGVLPNEALTPNVIFVLASAPTATADTFIVWFGAADSDVGVARVAFAKDYATGTWSVAVN